MESLQNETPKDTEHKNPLRCEIMETLKAEGRISHYSEEETMRLEQKALETAKRIRRNDDIRNTASFIAGYYSRNRRLGATK